MHDHTAMLFDFMPFVRDCCTCIVYTSGKLPQLTVRGSISAPHTSPSRMGCTDYSGSDEEDEALWHMETLCGVGLLL